jgi:hypothetical protein
MRSTHPTTPGALLAFLLSVACSDPSGPDVRTVGSIAISAPVTELAIGSSVQLQATLLNQTGAVISGGQVTWTSSDHAVATVGTGGRVDALGPGVTTITARSGDKSDNVTIRVVPPLCTSATVGAISLGQTRTGTLGAVDCMLYHGGPARGWRLDLAAATSILVELSSGAFEPLIWITDLQMNVIDLYANGQANTRLHRMLPAGSYVIWASSGDLREGAFQLVVRQGPPPCTAPDQAIAPGQSVSGTLGQDDCLFLDEVPAQGWQLDLTSATRVQVDLTTNAFDALILITDPAMNILTGNEGPGSNARLTTTLPAGSYFVWAIALDGREGAFTMSLDLVEPYSCPIPPQTTAVGQTVTGALTSTDCLFDNGTYADAWTLTIAATVRVRIDLTSNQFDTFLVLADSAGLHIAFDDDGGDNLNSRLEMELQPGQYTIWASSFAEGMTGTYQLAVQAVAGAPPTGGRSTHDDTKMLRRIRDMRAAATHGVTRQPDRLQYPGLSMP